MKKKCYTCKLDKETSDFLKKQKSKDGLSYECKACAILRRLRHTLELKKIAYVANTKICRDCQIEKCANDFHKNSCSDDGLAAYCKICVLKRHKEDYAVNIKNLSYAEHRKYLHQKWVLNNGKRHRHNQKAWQLKNADAIKKYKKEYRIINKKVIRKCQNEWVKNRLATDENYRIRIRLSRRIRKALKGGRKHLGTAHLIGCSIPALKMYLISLFTTGMTWELFMAGNIQIDHIKPCASFDLSKTDQQEKCFHYSNMQPLWKKDNMEKRDKLNWIPSLNKSVQEYAYV